MQKFEGHGCEVVPMELKTCYSLMSTKEQRRLEDNSGGLEPGIVFFDTGVVREALAAAARGHERCFHRLPC